MKYFLYARKSTDDEERQVLSIDAQLDELREYAKKESLHIVREFIESQTAKKPGRPVFNAMMDEIEQGKAGGILAWHPDRLARNSVDGGKIVYFIDCEFLSSLKFPTFWFEPTPQGKFMLSVAFGQSKYYVDNLSQILVLSSAAHAALPFLPNGRKATAITAVPRKRVNAHRNAIFERKL